jgi:hypothetical protein
MVYDVPTPFKTGLAKGLFSHWSIDPIYHFQTALPVNILAGTNYDGNILIIERPNFIPGVPIYVYSAQCAAQNGGNPCPGGWGLNDATQGAPSGATAAEASAAGCLPGSVVGAFLPSTWCHRDRRDRCPGDTRPLCFTKISASTT